MKNLPRKTAVEIVTLHKKKTHVVGAELEQDVNVLAILKKHLKSHDSRVL